MDKLKVLEYEINTKIINQEDYVSLTDIAKKVNEDEPRFVIQNWMRNKDTIDYWIYVKFLDTFFHEFIYFFKLRLSS